VVPLVGYVLSKLTSVEKLEAIAIMVAKIDVRKLPSRYHFISQAHFSDIDINSIIIGIPYLCFGLAGIYELGNMHVHSETQLSIHELSDIFLFDQINLSIDSEAKQSVCITGISNRDQRFFFILMLI